MMTVPSQLEGARLGGNLTLRCKSEAFPASINYWMRGERTETTVTPGERIRTDSVVQDHVTMMKLEILQVTPADFTSYKCVARNSLGETDGRIKVYGIDRGDIYIVIIFPLQHSTERPGGREQHGDDNNREEDQSEELSREEEQTNQET